MFSNIILTIGTSGTLIFDVTIWLLIELYLDGFFKNKQSEINALNNLIKTKLNVSTFNSLMLSRANKSTNTNYEKEATFINVNLTKMFINFELKFVSIMIYDFHKAGRHDI